MRLRDTRRGPLLQVLKSALATVLAWIAAMLLIGGQPPVFAAIAALLVVQPSVSQSVSKGIERSVGVILGVVVASVLAIALGSAWWVIAIAVTVGLLLAWSLRMTPGTANQIGISSLLVIALGATSPAYAVDRVLETLLGVVIGFVVNLAVVAPVQVTPARDDVVRLVDELAARMEALAHALRTPSSVTERTELLLSARLLRPMLAKAERTIASAEDSLSLNPRGARRRGRLDALRDNLQTVSPVITQVIGMTRTFTDRAEPGLADDPTVLAIADQLDRAAHDVRLLTTRVSETAVAGVDTTDSGSPGHDEPGALTRPLRVITPDPGHWVLVGSLLVDLERIHATLTGERE